MYYKISTLGFTTLIETSTLDFTTLMLNKNASISYPFLLTAPNYQEDEDSTLDNSLNDAVNSGSDVTHNWDVDMR